MTGGEIVGWLLRALELVHKLNGRTRRATLEKILELLEEAVQDTETNGDDDGHS